MKNQHPLSPTDDFINSRLSDLIERLFELADGVRVTDDQGEPAYRRPPDRLAIEYLIDRVLGRPISAKPSGMTDIGSVRIVTFTLPDNQRNNLVRELPFDEELIDDNETANVSNNALNECSDAQVEPKKNEDSKFVRDSKGRFCRRESR